MLIIWLQSKLSHRYMYRKNMMHVGIGIIYSFRHLLRTSWVIFWRAAGTIVLWDALFYKGGLAEQALKCCVFLHFYFFSLSWKFMTRFYLCLLSSPLQGFLNVHWFLQQKLARWTEVNGAKGLEFSAHALACSSECPWTEVPFPFSLALWWQGTVGTHGPWRKSFQNRGGMSRIRYTARYRKFRILKSVAAFHCPSSFFWLYTVHVPFKVHNSVALSIFVESWIDHKINFRTFSLLKTKPTLLALPLHSLHSVRELSGLFFTITNHSSSCAATHNHFYFKIQNVRCNRLFNFV